MIQFLSSAFLAIPDLDVVQVKGSNTERWNTKQNTGSLECFGGSYLDINPNGEVLRNIIIFIHMYTKGGLISEGILTLVPLPIKSAKSLP